MVRRTLTPKGCPDTCRAAVWEFLDDVCDSKGISHALTPGSQCYIYDILSHEHQHGYFRSDAWARKQTEDWAIDKTLTVPADKILLSQPWILLRRIEAHTKPEEIGSALAVRYKNNYLILRGNARVLSAYRTFGLTDIPINVVKKSLEELHTYGTKEKPNALCAKIPLTSFESQNRIVSGDFNDRELSTRFGLLGSFAQAAMCVPIYEPHDLPALDDSNLIYSSVPAPMPYPIPERFTALLDGKHYVIEPPWNASAAGPKWVTGVKVDSMDRVEELREFCWLAFYKYDHGKTNRHFFMRTMGLMMADGNPRLGHLY